MDGNSFPVVCRSSASEAIEVEFLRVPAGAFLMGAEAGRRDADVEETPRAVVTLPEFRICRFAVTVGL